MLSPGSPWPPRLDVLGIKVSCVDMDTVVATVEQCIARRLRAYVCVTGAHGVMESRRDQGLRQIHNDAGLVVPDGMPLVWFLRLCGRQASRVYGPDLMRTLTAVSAQRGYRQFYYGGTRAVVDQLRRRLQDVHPALEVSGTICPPFRTLIPEEDDAAVAAINQAQPDIVWVGLSTPKQERWMAAHLGRVQAPVMIGVGAAFDFLAGTKPQAPRWMQRHGLEWVFRLGSEPRRLWRRYAYIVPGFACLATGRLTANALHWAGHSLARVPLGRQR